MTQEVLVIYILQQFPQIYPKTALDITVSLFGIKF